MSILIGIGAEEEQYLPSLVLKHSILKHVSQKVEFIILDQAVHQSRYKTELEKRTGRTPFSLQRFLLAEQLISSSCDIGVYLDSDMLVFEDIAALCAEFENLNEPIATVSVDPVWKRKAQSSVLIMNRLGAKLLLDRFQTFLSNLISYDELMYFENIRGWSSISCVWNCLEYYDENTKLLHFTDMDTQPWLKSTNKFCGIWEIALYNALSSDEVHQEFLKSLEKGFIRPSLLELNSMPYRHYTGLKSLLADYLWIPPHRYKRIKNHKIRTLIAPLYHFVWITKIIKNGGLLNRV